VADWKSLGGSLIKAGAPIIGSALGGPLGGLIGSGLGDVLASALGVEATPEAVNNAIVNGDPATVSAALSKAETEACARYSYLTAVVHSNAAQSDSINQTIRAELASGQRWFAWRNLWGYSCAVEASLTSLLVLYSLALNPQIVKNIIDSYSFFLSWYALRFGVLGYIHNGASNEKIAAVTGEAPSIIKNIAKAVRGK